MPRINRKVRVRPQNRVTRAQILELLIGPNGETVFESTAQAQALWADLQQKYSPAFAATWHIAGGGDKPYAEMAAQYARQVVAGEVEACKWTRLACKRHLDDLTRAEKGDWLYLFDTAKAERACRFLEMLPHTKGVWAARSERMILQPWQAFIVCVLFGWVKAEKKDVQVVDVATRVTRIVTLVVGGLRRFSLAFILVPRKNGKSQMAAGIGLYMFACDGEFGAEVYSGATTEKQAYEVFRPANQMLARSPELAQALGVLVTTKKLNRPEDGSRFEVVVGKPGDGASPHCGIVDEYHEHDSDVLFDTFRTGMGARQQPFLFVISTAGDNTVGPCKLLQSDVELILDGQIERDEVFGIIYSIDKGDSWTAVESLPKANPNFGISVSREFLVTEQQAAILNPRKQGVFQTKYQDVWLGAIFSYFDVSKWNALADPKLRPESFIGLPTVTASDLSTKRDFTCRATIFRKSINGKFHYYIFVRFYLPQAQVNRKEAPHYKEWAAQGFIRVHEGATVDFELIQDETVEDVKAYRAREFAFDPWNASSLAQAVAKRTKAEAVEMLQVAKVMSPPMKELDAAIADGRVHHEGNPVLAWMIGNIMAKEDANENVFPRKEVGREENKIDGGVAVMMALARVQVAESDKIAYRGLRSVG